jgi:hypothetical protein
MRCLLSVLRHKGLAFGLAGCLGLALPDFLATQPASAASSTSPTVQSAYTAMLADPDNLDVNVALLEAQLDDGDFAAAAVTLQRILVLNPDFHQARLIRVAVFLRLGDDAGQRRSAYLETQSALAGGSAEAAAFGGAGPADPSAPTLAGRHPVWPLYDSNPGQRPGTFTLGGQAMRFPSEGSFGAFGELQFIGTNCLGAQGHSCASEGHGFARGLFEDSRGHSYARLAAGPRFDLGFAFLDLMAVAQAEFVGSHFYGSRLGGRARLIVDISDRLSASLRVEAAHDRADVNLFSTTNVGDGDGWDVSVDPSITYRISHSWDITTHVATTPPRTPAAPGSATMPMAAGCRFATTMPRAIRCALGGSVRDVSYDAINPNVIPATVARDERRYALGSGRRCAVQRDARSPWRMMVIAVGKRLVAGNLWALRDQ